MQDQLATHLARTLFRAVGRLVFARYLPIARGTVVVPGIEASVTIVRDHWGIPHIEAEAEHDAWFALGFCQAQDRTFQLEFLRRLVRGELAEVLGPPGLTFDRLARRVGFRRAALRQLPVIAHDVRAQVEAFLTGMRAGLKHGLRGRPLEFFLLRTEPQPWDVADVLALVKFLSFALASNWTSELVRLRVLLEDGPQALQALDPGLTDPEAVPRTLHGLANLDLDALVHQLDALRAFAGTIASNNWVIAGRRTRSGRPILANDPHWSPLLPSFWYLAHLRTPEWAIAGATLIGTPAFIAGQNGYAAWGVTAGLSDNTDLVLERLGPDGRSVLEGETPVPCLVHREPIHVRGQRPVTDLVLETRRGPIVSPALRDVPWALSLRAVWLDPLPVRGLLAMHRVRSFEEVEETFADWPHLPLNVVYADRTGRIGWLLAGTVPQRRRSTGFVPILGWENPEPWTGYVPADQLPRTVDPRDGFIATANNRPRIGENASWLGADFLDDYRVEGIARLLASRTDWTLGSTLAAQLDTYALHWEDLRERFLSVTPRDQGSRAALELLRAWDGYVRADSPAATVFELVVHQVARSLAQRKAPGSWRWVLGAGFHDSVGGTSWGVRRIGHLARVLTEPTGEWDDVDRAEAIATALSEVVRALAQRYGDDPHDWSWGSVRPLYLTHPLGAVPALRWLFDRGPLAIGGDANTINPGGVSAHDPLGAVQFIASLRFAVEIDDWDNARIVLAGGQAGHPLSPHYDDLLAHWLQGETVPLAWSEQAVNQVAAERLTLVPQ
ncbi:penicillin acylase family protein [Thermomicrobium sp. 4228-Ro]|uniref:penicillin acylase family protein n=1 Tax=Thermomicrobium sp. 4228-Ro TaxID=2993937 RepID=UPI002248E628|nr:penicillin acylase family protein [Thermomicrobium sp. 4228-Ro]MCX2727610.1 penicillin acylase family protein [Thermomicrobium sp. 4228-Ro]